MHHNHNVKYNSTVFIRYYKHNKVDLDKLKVARTLHVGGQPAQGSFIKYND